MDNASASDMNTSNHSLQKREQILLQRSGQAVACHSSIPDASESSLPSKVLICLLAGFCKEILSRDKLMLAVDAGRSIAKQQGISDEDYSEYTARFMKVAEKVRRTNPLSGLF